MKAYIFPFLALFLSLSCKNKTKHPLLEEQIKEKTELLLVGTYTRDSDSKGIYALQFNPESGELKKVGNSPFLSDPSYLAIHPNGIYIYAVNSTKEFNGEKSGSITSLKFNRDSLSFKIMNSVSSKGENPCFTSLSPNGRFCFVACYTGGNVTMHETTESGELSLATTRIKHEGFGPSERQKEAHAHQIIPGINPNYLYSPDLGADTIFIYALDTLNSVLHKTFRNFGLAPGSGPRHMAFHPANNWAYILGELDGTVTFCKVNPENGSLEKIGVYSTMIGHENQMPHAGDIHISPDGKHLYATNRGEVNNLAHFSIDEKSGELTYQESTPTGGKTPRNFVIHESGNFLLVANRNSNNIRVFRIDGLNGKLIETSQEIELPKPVCLKFYGK